MELISIPDYSAWKASGERKYAAATSTAATATASTVAVLLSSGSAVGGRLGPLAHSEVELPCEPHECLPFLPQWTWKKPNYCLLHNQTGQPLFFTVTDDDEKCVQKWNAAGGASTNGGNVTAAVYYVWRAHAAAGRALVNGEMATIEYVKYRCLTIGFGRHVAGPTARAPDYYSLRWDAVRLVQGIKYTFYPPDADEQLDLGKLSSWNEYSWTSGKPKE